MVGLVESSRWGNGAHPWLSVMLWLVGWFPSLQETMAEEPHRSSAAEIAVTSNGEADSSHDDVFQRVGLKHWSHTPLTKAHMDLPRSFECLQYQS